ncbi:hypothetical protein A2U01_0090747, partial [Trifolium medium]|nr:hypothetical protein [Trifolium medium]
MKSPLGRKLGSSSRYLLAEALVILASSTVCHSTFCSRMYCPRRLIALTSAAMTVSIGAPGGS